MSITFLAVLAAPQAASAAVQSLWHMEEPAPPHLATTMVDSGPAQNIGTPHNVTAGVAGRLGMGFGFNGTNSIVTVPNSASLNADALPFTFAISVNMTGLPRDDSNDLIRKGLATNSKWYWKMELLPNTARTATKVRCYYRGSKATASVYALPSIGDGKWHDIACIKTDTQIKIVVDGKVRTRSIAVGSFTNAQPLTIGAKTPSQDRLKGTLDEARFEK